MTRGRKVNQVTSYAWDIRRTRGRKVNQVTSCTWDMRMMRGRKVNQVTTTKTGSLSNRFNKHQNCQLLLLIIRKYQNECKTVDILNPQFQKIYYKNLR